MKQSNNACKSELETSLLFRGYEKLTVATYMGVICTEVSSAVAAEHDRDGGGGGAEAV